MTDLSALLVKPDCIALGLQTDVREEIERSGLKILCEHEVHLTSADISTLWKEYDPVDHPLTVGLLRRYLCSAPSRLLVVEGKDPLSSGRQAKRQVRRRWAQGVFANVLHSPETEEEMQRQRVLFSPYCDRLPTGGAPLPAPAVRKAPSDAFADLEDLAAQLEDAWRVLQTPHSPPTPYVLDDAVGTAEVHLGVDSQNSVDSAVAAVWHACPGLSLPEAIVLTLHAGRHGGMVLATGSAERVQACWQALRDRGIVNCWTSS